MVSGFSGSTRDMKDTQGGHTIPINISVGIIIPGRVSRWDCSLRIGETQDFTPGFVLFFNGWRKNLWNCVKLSKNTWRCVPHFGKASWRKNSRHELCQRVDALDAFKEIKCESGD